LPGFQAGVDVRKGGTMVARFGRQLRAVGQMETERRLFAVLDVAEKRRRSIAERAKHNGHVQGKYIRNCRVFVRAWDVVG